jgi:ferredoxin
VARARVSQTAESSGFVTITSRALRAVLSALGKGGRRLEIFCLAMCPLHFSKAGSAATLPQELELELIQTHMKQNPLLRVKVGAVSCSRCACVAHKGHAREKGGRGQARRARRLVVCVRVCDSDSLSIIKKLL